MPVNYEKNIFISFSFYVFLKNNFTLESSIGTYIII
jgi:hypothetical protein